MRKGQRKSPCPFRTLRYFLAGSGVDVDDAGGVGAAGGAVNDGAGATALAGAEIGVGGGIGMEGVAAPIAKVPSSGTIINATMLMILINGLTAGPAVSL